MSELWKREKEEPREINKGKGKKIKGRSRRRNALVYSVYIEEKEKEPFSRNCGPWPEKRLEFPCSHHLWAISEIACVLYYTTSFLLAFLYTLCSSLVWLSSRLYIRFSTRITYKYNYRNKCVLQNTFIMRLFIFFTFEIFWWTQILDPKRNSVIYSEDG